MEIEWNDQTEFPGELNKAHNGFSVDVHIHDTSADEISVGWYDWKKNDWKFLSNEQIKKFKWRYFQDEIDKYKSKKTKNVKKQTIKKSSSTKRN